MFKRWRKAKARIWQISPSNYIRVTPDIGFALAWFRSKTGQDRRIRFAWFHGLQLVEWRIDRWVVTKQLLGKSRVIGGGHLMHLSKTRR